MIQQQPLSPQEEARRELARRELQRRRRQAAEERARANQRMMGLPGAGEPQEGIERAIARSPAGVGTRFVTSALQGLNLSDEVLGGGVGLAARAFGADQEQAREAADVVRQTERERVERYREDRPVSSFLEETAALGTITAPLGGVGVLSRLGQAAPRAMGAIAGGIEGAISGFGAGEDSGERLRGTFFGLGTGAGGGALFGDLFSRLTRRSKARIEAEDIPGADAIMDEASALYDELDELGVEFAPDATRALRTNINNVLREVEFVPEAQPTANTIVNRVNEALEGGIGMRGLDRLRRRVRSTLVQSNDADNREIGQALINQIDNWVQEVPDDLISTNASRQALRQVDDDMAQARQLYRQQADQAGPQTRQNLPGQPVQRQTQAVTPGGRGLGVRIPDYTETTREQIIDMADDQRASWANRNLQRQVTNTGDVTYYSGAAGSQFEVQTNPANEVFREFSFGNRLTQGEAPRRDLVAAILNEAGSDQMGSNIFTLRDLPPDLTDDLLNGQGGLARAGMDRGMFVYRAPSRGSTVPGTSDIFVSSADPEAYLARTLDTQPNLIGGVALDMGNDLSTTDELTDLIETAGRRQIDVQVPTLREVRNLGPDGARRWVNDNAEYVRRDGTAYEMNINLPSVGRRVSLTARATGDGQYNTIMSLDGSFTGLAGQSGTPAELRRRSEEVFGATMTGVLDALATLPQGANLVFEGASSGRDGRMLERFYRANLSRLPRGWIGIETSPNRFRIVEDSLDARRNAEAAGHTILERATARRAASPADANLPTAGATAAGRGGGRGGNGGGIGAGGSAGSSDNAATQFRNTLRSARSTYRRAAQADELANALERARIRAQRAGSGGNFENYARQELSRYIDPRRSRRLQTTFDADQMEAISDFVLQDESIAARIGRSAGNFAPSRGGLGAGAMVYGAATKDPVTAGLGAMVTQGANTAREARNMAQLRDLERFVQTGRRGNEALDALGRPLVPGAAAAGGTAAGQDPNDRTMELLYLLGLADPPRQQP